MVGLRVERGHRRSATIAELGAARSAWPLPLRAAKEETDTYDELGRSHFEAVAVDRESASDSATGENTAQARGVSPGAARALCRVRATLITAPLLLQCESFCPSKVTSRVDGRYTTRRPSDELRRRASEQYNLHSRSEARPQARLLVPSERDSSHLCDSEIEVHQLTLIASLGVSDVV